MIEGIIRIGLRKRALSAFLPTAILTIALAVTAVSAYGILPNTCNFSTYQYNLSWYYVNQGTVNLVNYCAAGATAWDNSAAPVDWHQEADFGNMKIYNQFMGNTGWHAATKPPRTNNLPNNGWVNVNESYYGEWVGNTSELIAHELGHSLRLADVTDMTALMRWIGYKGSPVPSADDVAGVDSVY